LVKYECFEEISEMYLLSFQGYSVSGMSILRVLILFVAVEAAGVDQMAAIEGLQQ
jgi:hypothetical protein